MDNPLQNRYQTACPELYSENHLIWLGTQNSEWNQLAREILASRGQVSRFLREYEKCLTADQAKRDRGLSRAEREMIKPGSWLAPTPTGKCVCGKWTARKFNGYWQCESCADGCKRFGYSEWNARFEARKKPKKAKPKTVKTSSEVIPTSATSYEAAITAGAPPDVVKAIGDREAIAAAEIAYNESKLNSPLARAIQEVRHAA